MKVKDARNRSKYKQGGEVKRTNTELVYSKRDEDDNYTIVVEKPTPTKDKPGDTRLYRGDSDPHVSSDAPLTMKMRNAKLKADAKSEFAQSDSLTRGDYEKLINPPIKEIKKKKKFFKRKKK